MKPLFASAWLLVVCAGAANAISIQDTHINGIVVRVSVKGVYSGPLKAGVHELLVDGTPMDAICIDPFHAVRASSGGYSFTSLDGAPKPPGTMNASEALRVCELWAIAYSPFMNAKQAAALQIAVWEIVGGNRFAIRGKDYGARTLLRRLRSFSGSVPDLIALTGPGQDFVVLTPPGSGEETPPSNIPPTVIPPQGEITPPTVVTTPTPSGGNIPPPSNVSDASSSAILMVFALAAVLACRHSNRSSASLASVRVRI